MRRKQITQIMNTNWCPPFLKRLLAEFLSWFVLKVNATKPFIPVINEMLAASNQKHIVNIDFNIGAGIESVKPFLDKDITVDSIPIQSFNTEQSGLYLFANCFHQLPATKAKNILQEIVKSENPIVVVEGNNDSLWQVVGMTFFLPLTILLCSPLVKPFRFSRLIFTYLIPVLPIIAVIDGSIALMKLYNPSDLKILTNDIAGYEWKAAKNDNGRGGKIMYLTGRKAI